MITFAFSDVSPSLEAPSSVANRSSTLRNGAQRTCDDSYRQVVAKVGGKGNTLFGVILGVLVWPVFLFAPVVPQAFLFALFVSPLLWFGFLQVFFVRFLVFAELLTIVAFFLGLRHSKRARGGV